MTEKKKEEIWHRGNERPKTDGHHVVEVLAIIGDERHLGDYMPESDRLGTLEDEGEFYKWEQVDYWLLMSDIMPENVKSIK